MRDYGPYNPVYDKQVYQEQQAAAATQAKDAVQAKKVEDEAKLQAYFEDLEYQRSLLDICASSYSADRRRSSLTATELAEAAISNCAYVVDKIRQSAVDILAQLHTNLDDRAALVQHTVDTSVARARGACLRALAEYKK